MMTNFYEKAVNILTSKEKFHIKLGLDRVERVLTLFDNPQNDLKVIHIAGTNGKGSTCAILNQILIESGYKTGLFTSPHLVKYTERIKINNQNISDEEFFKLLIEIEEKCKANDIYLTEFEILTVAGFIWFERQKVDIAVIEVGLGGRLDATNVIQTPIMSIITSISKDHTDRLGNTIEKIAYEKAGIIKQTAPCIIDIKNNGFNTIKKVSSEKNASLTTVSYDIKTLIKNNKNYAIINNKEYEFALLGQYQGKNLSLAINTINKLNKNGFSISEKSIETGLKKVKHNARFEYLEDLNIIIDGAHNADGAENLRESIDTLYPNTPVIFVYATLKTKDYESILNTLVKEKDKLYLFEFNHPAAMKINDLSKKLCYNANTLKTAEEIISLALSSKSEGIPLIVTGSLYAIGEIYSSLKNVKKYYPIR